MANTTITPPPSESSNIVYGNTTVKDKLDSLSTDISSKVSNTGGTISGDVTINAANGAAGLAGWSGLILGNSTPQETAGNSTGYLRLFGRNDKRIDIYSGTTLTDDRNLTLPDKSGTIALISDLTNKLNNHIQLVTVDHNQTNKRLTFDTSFIPRNTPHLVILNLNHIEDSYGRCIVLYCTIYNSGVTAAMKIIDFSENTSMNNFVVVGKPSASNNYTWQVDVTTGGSLSHFFYYQVLY